MDVSVNYVIKSINTDVVCDHVAERVSASLQQAPADVPRLDVSLGTLKPLVVRGFLNGIAHFEREEGRQTVVKGFSKANLLRCFEPDFQRVAVSWMTQQARNFSINEMLNPTTAPGEHEEPPSALTYVDHEDRNHLDELPVAFDEDELLDLVGDD
jgi:hypothetical protein